MAESPVSRFAYRAFISYSHRDKAWADWLHKALETYSVPSRLVGTETAHGRIPHRLNPIFRDRDELASATDLGRKVNEALAQSENQIVICSPASAASRWVNEEVLAYKRMGRAERIFCLIVDGEPNATDMPGREAEECFCPALRFQLDANGLLGHERTEPIAADARAGKDGKQNAKLKLIAGMLDVGFDALKQREQHRRMRRMAMLTAAAMAVMVVTIVLAIFALVSRHAAVVAQDKAVNAEHAAVVARDDARRRQAQAEDILGFMLGDLRRKLSTVGRLDLMRSVDDKATAYFATLKPRDLTDTALEEQARLLMDIGQVRLAAGELDAATAAFREALDRTSALYKRAPRNGNRLFDRAQAEYWVGYAAMQKGDNATAEAMFQRYYASAVKLAAMDRSNFKWQKEVAYGLQAVSVMDKTLGRTAEAERGMEQQLAMYHVWLKQHPGNLQLRQEAANVVSWLGSLAQEQGQLAVAEDRFAENVGDLKQNMGAEPNNTDWKDDSVYALVHLAEVQKQRGKLGPARANFAAATAIAAVLYAQDPENNDWRWSLATCRLLHSELDAVDQPRKAMAEAADAMSLLAAARTKDAKSQSVLTGLGHAHNLLAQLALSRGDTAGAAQNVAAALALIEPAWKAAQNNSLRQSLAGTRLLQGEVAQREGRSADATHAWNEARELLTADARPEIPFDRLDPLVRVLRLLGRSAEAAPYLQRLAAAGYVPLQHWPEATKTLADTRAQRTDKANARR
ncbi:MAG TPA: toll/interleukin-1 receptor domain-containing protein [Rhodanobacteraceae bacterium]|nr:toll/interleukin-1 receptor domain-containing protein [Rhodanobacteraceae bacterium]